MNTLSTLSDEEIVNRVKNKNTEIYSEIIKRYQKKLIRYALYVTGDEHVAHDIVQESFIKAYINIQGFNEKKKFSSWIYRIVHNESINTLSKTQRYVSFNNKVDFPDENNMEDDLIKKELKKYTHTCLKKMDIIYREPLSLYFLEDKTYEEISDIMRLPISTVGTRIKRAKIIFKRICKNIER